MDGRTLREAANSGDFMLYTGMTCQLHLRDEAFRFLTSRGSTPSLLRSGKVKAGGKNRPVLLRANGDVITRSFAENKLLARIILLGTYKLRVNACKVEDLIQSHMSNVDKVKIPCRLHRHVAKGMKNDKVKEAKEIYKTFITVFRIQMIYAAKDSKGRPKFVKVNGHKLQIQY